MKRRFGSLAILCMIFLSSMIIIFQDSHLTPYFSQEMGISGKNSPDTSALAQEAPDDAHTPKSLSDFSKAFYTYKNSTVIKANTTIDYLISKLWDLSFKGFNESDATNAKKRTSDNMLMIRSLLEYNDASAQAAYVTYAEDTFQFEYKYLWDTQAKLFQSYCDRNGNNPAKLLNSSDNALAILALLKLFGSTANQTYLEFANLTYNGLISKFYDSTNGGFYRSNATGDNAKFTYENLLVCLALTEIYQSGYLSSVIRFNALDLAKKTLDKLISYYLNDSYGFFSSGSNAWKNPITSKSAFVNSLAIITLISLYDAFNNQTYLDLASGIARFIDTAYWDSHGVTRGYNSTVTWNGKITLDSTKYLATNSLILEAFLKLFEKSYNSTHYLDALNISRFLNIYLWDSHKNAYNYSINFPAASSSLKSTFANAWAIQALLSYRYLESYLTRANTTMTMLNRYMYSEGAFDGFVMYNWDPLSSIVVLAYPVFVTLADLFKVAKSASTNLLSIYTLIELAEETHLNNYISLANKTMYTIINYAFKNAFATNISGNPQEKLVYTTEMNAWGILTLLKLYEKIHDPLFLEIANKTWYYLKNNLWDSVNYGYNPNSVDNTTKDLIGNCLMIWANLALIRANYTIFNNIRSNASTYVNQTIGKINQKMWDSTNSGYYSNASRDWTPVTTGKTVKNNYQNNFMIQTLILYNDFYPTHSNRTLYEVRINRTVKFLLNHLWDWEVGGFYLSSYANGSSPVTDKYTYGNDWAVLTLLELYRHTGNFTYYLLAEDLIDFINTYLWDEDYGGYFHSCSKDGTPLIFGTYAAYLGTVPLSFKIFENQIASILALTRLSVLKRTFPLPLIVDLTFTPENIDRGANNLQVTLNLIDTEGNPINKANLTLLTSGLVKTVVDEKFYGFATRTKMKNVVGTNHFSANLDISRFFGYFHLSILAYNYSMAATWLFVSNNRTFDVYLTSAFALLMNLNLVFWENTYGGYKKMVTAGLNLTKYAFDNWMAILASLEFYNNSGLNLMYNTTNYNNEQILTNYILRTFKFLNNTLRYNSVNKTSIAFFTSAKWDGTGVSTKILCRDTALAIIALLKYYEITNVTDYLSMANRTWSYLNSTLWDPIYSGYIFQNGLWGNQTKYSEDNLWAILANLAIYNTPQITALVRASALKMANKTLELLLQNVWDVGSSGFFAAFNGSTWIPFSTSASCKQTGVNALAIQALVKFAELNNPERQDYIIWANKTILFMNNILRDKALLGYFSACNKTGTISNTNKTLTENSWMISALIDLYRINNFNYTYYQLAEETMFFLDRYFRNPYLTVYHEISSQFGAITYDFGSKTVPVESSSNFNILRSLIQMDWQRRTLNYPLVIKNINIEAPHLGKIQNTVNVTLEIFDKNNQPIQNATVMGVIYGKYQLFTFTKLVGNKYYCILNISTLAGTMELDLLAFKKGYSLGTKMYLFSRYMPTYIQKSYETIIALLVKLWSTTDNIFYMDDYNSQFGTSANFMVIEALLNFAKVGGDILWIFDWFANQTFSAYAKIAAQNLRNTLGSSAIRVDSKNVSGYVAETSQTGPSNTATSASNALAILGFVDLYNRTSDPYYLEMANNTWLYFNKTFWDPTYRGYLPGNSTDYTNKSLYDNCMAILADLAINETVGINPTIRNQAYYLAYLTFLKINQSFWDTKNGTYYTHSNRDWTSPYNRFTDGNALMILTQLKFYAHDSTQKNYLRMANITADLLIKNFYDSKYGGFYQYVLDNFSQPVLYYDTIKYLSDNAWAVLALAELYGITKNTTFYYKAEDTMNFINSYLENHYNSYLASAISDINGYWDGSNRSGYVYGKDQDKYVGSLEPGASTIRALVKLYSVADLTLPWLNATVQLLPASFPPKGEYCNLTISLFNEIGTKITTATLNVTISGWQRESSDSLQKLVNPINYIYDSATQQYKIKNVNLTDLEDVYFSVYAKTTAYATWWGVFYLHRTGSIISILLAQGADYISSEDYWQYTIGEDKIIIEALYTDMETLAGIPGAYLNFTVNFPNNTRWFTQFSRTNLTGWARLSFGPISNVATLFGYYNITIIGTHVNSTIYPKTWYSSTRSIIRLNVDFGISIPVFYPLDALVAQGDKVPCNVTIKHRMLANLTVNILIYSQDVFLPSQVTRNLTTGLNYLLIDVWTDERTPIGEYKIYLNVSYQNKVIRKTFFFVGIVSAAMIRNYFTPTFIAQDDVRYAVLEIEHRKKYDTSNLSVQINCAALEVNPTFEILEALAWQDYYFPLKVRNDIPYGTYSGEIIVQRVNYTLKYNDLPLTFQIEVKPSILVQDIQVPTEIVQNQHLFIAIKIANNKITPISIKIIGSGGAFNYFEDSFTINPAETTTLNIPLVYNANPWDSGSRSYTLEIYYLNSTSYSLVSSNTYQIEVNYSTNNILLGFILPATIIGIIVIYFLWFREKKRREQKKLK